jgi:hypothetical protein
MKAIRGTNGLKVGKEVSEAIRKKYGYLWFNSIGTGKGTYEEKCNSTATGISYSWCSLKDGHKGKHIGWYSYNHIVAYIFD